MRYGEFMQLVDKAWDEPKFQNTTVDNAALEIVNRLKKKGMNVLFLYDKLMRLHQKNIYKD